MSVKVTFIQNDEDNLPVFEAYDIDENRDVEVKNWFEKSKDKWHIVLGPNSANRKYLAHNEFFAKAEDNEYIIQDRTTAPRKLGTAQPDRKLIPFMTEEDKEKYDAIIARALENRAAQREVLKEVGTVESIEAKIAKLQAKLEALQNEEV